MAEELVELFAEFVGSPVREIEQGVASFAAANVIEWENTPGTTWEEKAATFYNTAPGYIFDLIRGNQSKAHLKSIYQRYGHWESIVASGHEVLEFGGGLGVACALFSDLGRKVTYVDVAGPAAMFAQWYLQTRGYVDIEMLQVEPTGLTLPAGRQWDFVFSDSVIEHLIDPQGTVETLAEAVRPGGVLYLIIDAHTVEPGFPMHRHIQIGELLRECPTLAAMEHVKHDGDVVNVFRRL